VVVPIVPALIMKEQAVLDLQRTRENFALMAGLCGLPLKQFANTFGLSLAHLNLRALLILHRQQERPLHQR
jgi:hypothetical protein